MVERSGIGLIPTFEEIRRGDTTDIYFLRTMEVLRAKGRDRAPVVMEGFAKALPRGWDWAVLSGMDEMLRLLEGRAVTVRAMPEGTLFGAGEPVFEIEGPYGEFCEMETAMLGVLCQATGIATRAARLRIAAGDRSVLSFGARRMHPALSTMIDRNAFVGGADGVSVVRSARYLGEPPSGTMPHALVLVIGDTVEAMLAFDECCGPEVPRICLIDTLQDEKFEALRVAEALGKRLAAVRLDTPSSRRGDLRRILQEVRWELDLRGFRHVRLIASGGLGEEDVLALRDVADGFGVGTWLSNAPTVDFSQDLVVIDGVPRAKRGKWSGAKRPMRCPGCGARATFPAGDPPDPARCPSCGGMMEPRFAEAIRDGRLLTPPLSPRRIRQRVLEQLEGRHLESERKP